MVTRYWSMMAFASGSISRCCELLSKRIFDILEISVFFDDVRDFFPFFFTDIQKERAAEMMNPAALTVYDGITALSVVPVLLSG